MSEFAPKKKMSFPALFVPIGAIVVYYLNSTGQITIPYEIGHMLSQVDPLFAIIAGCVMYADDSLAGIFPESLRWVYRVCAGGFLSYLHGVI